MMNDSVIARIKLWIQENGMLKAASRLIMVAGVVVALILAGFGVADMLKVRAAEEVAATEKKIVSEQKKEAKKLKAAAEKEAKANAAEGEEIPKIEIDYTTIEVQVDPVKYPLENYFSNFITGYLGWIFVSVVSGVALSSVVGSLKDMYLALKKAGPWRVTAGAIFWLSVVVAAVVAVMGIAYILEMDKTTMSAVLAERGLNYVPMSMVLSELAKKYLVWSLASVVIGFVLKKVIVMVGRTRTADC